MSGLPPKWITLALKEKKPGLFQTSEQKFPDILTEKSWICPILGQSDPLLIQTGHPCDFVTVTSDHFRFVSTTV